MRSIILDTDIGSDCDDVGAIVLLNRLEQLAEARILCITSVTSREFAPDAITAICRYCGRDDIPVGRLSEEGFMTQDDCYVAKMREAFFPERETPQKSVDAVRLIRKTLSGLTGEKATLVAIGPLRNFARLLLSPPDDLSPLSGQELVLEKAEEAVVMGGSFDLDYWRTQPVELCETEYNIRMDIAGAQDFVRLCPVPVVFTDYYLGEPIRTGGRLVKQGDMQNPLTFAYTVYCGGARQSWDLTAVLYAVRGARDYWTLSEPGHVSVENDGRTIFTPAADGLHRRLKPRMAPEAVAAEIDTLLESIRPR